ncbi:hypothetical protein GQR58_018918 [Nymphon striatum]|nr:hypothetical protein GQR58_018918 [Nymphon striatum]
MHGHQSTQCTHLFRVLSQALIYLSVSSHSSSLFLFDQWQFWQKGLPVSVEQNFLSTVEFLSGLLVNYVINRILNSPKLEIRCMKGEEIVSKRPGSPSTNFEHYIYQANRKSQQNLFIDLVMKPQILRSTQDAALFNFMVLVHNHHQHTKMYATFIDLKMTFDLTIIIMISQWSKVPKTEPTMIYFSIRIYIYRSLSLAQSNVEETLQIKNLTSIDSEKIELSNEVPSMLSDPSIISSLSLPEDENRHTQKSISGTSFKSCFSFASDEEDYFSTCQSFSESDDDDDTKHYEMDSCLAKYLLTDSSTEIPSNGMSNRESHNLSSRSYIDIEKIIRRPRANSTGFFLDGSEVVNEVWEGQTGGESMALFRFTDICYRSILKQLGQRGEYSDDYFDWTVENSDCGELSDSASRRIRRNRRQFSNRSRSSKFSTDSRFSSDMDDYGGDDDEEDEEDFSEYVTGCKIRYGVIRQANSEPFLPSMNSSNSFGIENSLIKIVQKLQTVHAKNPADFVTDIIGGQLKSYSFDGVNVNLPVPYRAKFRQKKLESKNVHDIGRLRSTYSPLRMIGNGLKRRHLFVKSKSDSINTKSSLSRDVLEEEREEELKESDEDLRVRVDLSPAANNSNKLSGNLSNIMIKQELSEIHQNLPLRPDSMLSEISETNTLTETLSNVYATENDTKEASNIWNAHKSDSFNNVATNKSQKFEPEISKRRKMFYVQSTDTFDSDEEFDVNFMKKLEVKTAALSASQEFSRGINLCIGETQYSSIKRPTSLTSLQKVVISDPDEENKSCGLRKWKAATNLTDLLAQYASEDSDNSSLDIENPNSPSGNSNLKDFDDVSLETLIFYDAIADELVFDAFCDAFVVLTESVFKPTVEEIDKSTKTILETSEIKDEQMKNVVLNNTTNVQTIIETKQNEEDKYLKEAKEEEIMIQAKPIVSGEDHSENSQEQLQLRCIVEWLAASRTGAPRLEYYLTSYKIQKLDVIVKTLRRRNWTVGDLTLALFRYCETVINMRNYSVPHATPVPLFVYLLDCATRRTNSEFSSDSYDSIGTFSS